MANKYQLQQTAQLKGKNIFFDANVLIYLFWPTGRQSFERNYARVFRNLLRQKNTLSVNFLVISEVINRMIRIEHGKYDSSVKFKDYRNSREGKEALSDIYLIVKDNILNRFDVVGKSFSQQEIEDLLVVDELDFVDKAIVTTCKENTLVLLTNDRDFKNADIDILSGNPRLLN